MNPIRRQSLGDPNVTLTKNSGMSAEKVEAVVAIQIWFQPISKLVWEPNSTGLNYLIIMLLVNYDR